MKGYIVVFEGTGSSKSNYKGIRTSITYPSKEAFDASRAESDNEDIIVAEGISEEQASHLTSQTSGKAVARAAYESIKREGIPPDIAFSMGTIVAREEGHLAEYTAELLVILNEIVQDAQRIVTDISTKLDATLANMAEEG